MLQSLNQGTSHFMHAPIEADTIAIRATNVTLSFGTGEARVEVLRGVDLEIMRGESLAILGASGSGKSSLMAVLSGLERASGGEVMVGGVDFGALDEDKLAGLGADASASSSRPFTCCRHDRTGECRRAA
jgi:predicted ABC-type transport system involved in lysophospholipase L1 biosynthesis ATPase subunit